MQRKLTPKQIRSLGTIATVGLRLIEDIGYLLVDAYTTGLTVGEIVDTLKIEETYGLNRTLARSSVGVAFRGYDGSLEIKAYGGLIPDKTTRDMLARKHRSANGTKTFKDEVGVHGRTTSQMKEDGRKGYLKTIAIMPVEDRIRAQGLVPWTEDEKKSAYEMLHNDGRSCLEIAKELNTKFHNGEEVRKEKAVEYGIRRYRQDHHLESLTREEKIRRWRAKSLANLQLAMKARGITAWSEQEKRALYEMSCDPQYKRGTLLRGKEMADSLNTRFHNGKPVRNSGTAREALREYLQKLS